MAENNKIHVCTLMWGTAWERYGSIFADTFTKYWDENIDLTLVTDKELPFDRANQINLNGLNDYIFFKERWKFNPIIKKCDKNDYWKYDALKWMPQAIAPKATLKANPEWKEGDIFVWLDADIETHKYVNSDWIQKILGEADIACLQRPITNIHTEIGFYAMTLNSITKKILTKFSTLYTSYKIFNYEQWHSAFAWDIAVSENNKSITINNLNTSKIKTNHVFPLSILAEKLEHKKGHRKLIE